MWEFFKKSFQVFKKLYFKLNVFRYLSKKQAILIFAGIAFIVLIFPTNYAHAGFWMAVIAVPLITAIFTGGAIAVANYATKALTWLFLAAGVTATVLIFGKLHLQIGSAMLRWAASNPLGSLTNPAQNDIIRIGWTVLRDMTNMFFVLGLAYIGLATALNISKFETKKTFAKLLLFAMLINFTPVIAGVVVDAANITTDFFLSSVDYEKFVEVYKTAETNKIELTKDNIGTEEPWAKFIMLSLYAFICGTVLWLFALLFLMRIFAIWILVIISPIAFFAGIFDKTKQHFKTWWDMFIKWSFIAVPAGFFLYLSHHLLVAALNNPITKTGGSDGFLDKFFAGMTPYIIAVIFLCIGFQAARKINVAGSQMIVGALNHAVVRAKTLPAKTGKLVSEKVGPAISGAMTGAVAGAMMSSKAASDAKASGKSQTMARLRSTFTKKGQTEGRKEYHKRLEQAPMLRRFVKPGKTIEEGKKRYGIEESRKLTKNASQEERELMLGRGSALGASDASAGREMAALIDTIGYGKFKEADHLKYIQKLKDKGIDTIDVDLALKQANPYLASELDKGKFDKKVRTLTGAGVTAAAAREQAKTDMAQEAIREMSTKEFANNFKSSNFAATPTRSVNFNGAMAEALDVAKIRAWARMSPGKEKQNFKSFLTNPHMSAHLMGKVHAAAARGDRKEQQRLTALIREIRTNPNL